ncbi:MAG: hypothetical protein A3I05_08965 [Deltaproteobacteria bacterium RIFCSPLOWO2_02_FULL_44_10]|nr:MAG: hypothetical protein A3C46_08650 [Deltaproteobacteria bacterium RIFCSPHIGHO2_02_FULL_44_16]OGQ45236.1 MAG: hypothetical protein A3I05_08965 [Deltaproteobacteria bacterium RIFCSPLOWO2_02_FULL_44_10]
MPKRQKKKTTQKTTPAPAKKKTTKKKSSLQPHLKRVSWNSFNVRQAAAYLSETLRQKGHDPVLVGAACAAIYAPAIQPKTLDFVITEYHIEEMEKLMRGFGFQPRELRSFWNPKVSFEIHFSPPPLSAGDETIEETVVVRSQKGVVKLLNVTDCVRQRLGIWYRWGDEEGLEQAVKICLQHDVDMQHIKRWSEWEWAVDKFQEFFSRVTTEKQKKEKR